MRRLYTAWSEKKLFTRQVRWFADIEDGAVDIQLNFDDETGCVTKAYTKPDSTENLGAAMLDWLAFKNGTLTVTKIRELISGR